MDNLTHTLTGIAISHAGINRKTRFATLTLIIAANAPDLDIVSAWKGSLAYLQYHRGISHSLVGIVALAVIIWALILWLGKKVRPKPGPPIHPRWLLLAAFLGTGSHLLLDFTNSYGVRPFLPFSGRWYAWDIMYIIDPLLLVIFVIGLAVPWILRLTSEEVGARKASQIPGAVFCLAALLTLWGVRDFAHRRALIILDSHTYSGEAPLRFSALPVAVNPFIWTGIVETDDAFQINRVDSRDANAVPEETATVPKPLMSPALAAAAQTPPARIFLDFARFPWSETEQTEQGYDVELTDLRFYHPSAPSHGFTLQVELDKSLAARSEIFYFTPPRDSSENPRIKR